VRRAAAVRRIISASQILPPVDEEDRPPICPRCGVTMVPAALSADDEHEGEWVCLECEELGEDA